MLAEYVLLAVIGLCGGFFTATGFFALITMLGIINRYAQNTRTALDIVWYEEAVIWGVTFGSLWFVFSLSLRIGNGGLALIGLLGGIYAGCLAVALAETIKAIPIMVRRTGMKKGIGTTILLFALGKGIGSLVYFFVLNYFGG